LRTVVRISVAVWAGHVKDDFYRLVFAGLRVKLAIDCGESVKQLVSDISEDGGGFREVLLILRELGVGGAVRGIKGSDVEAATLAVGEAMRATNGVVDGAGVSNLLGHFSFLGWDSGCTPRGQRRRF
jgi:hypothetical protein